MNKKMSKKKKNVVKILNDPTTTDSDLFLRRRQVQRKVIVKILAEIDPPPDCKQNFTSEKESTGHKSEDERYEVPRR
jgi:hypothetical protein